MTPERASRFIAGIFLAPVWLWWPTGRRMFMFAVFNQVEGVNQ